MPNKTDSGSPDTPESTRPQTPETHRRPTSPDARSEAGGRTDPPELKAGDVHISQLLESELWNNAPEERFDRFTRLAARVFNAPAAFILLFDRDRASLKSRFGFQLCASAREAALCRRASRQHDVFVVEDIQDSEFATDDPDPAPTEPGDIRFFAGRALRTATGQVVGCLAVADCKPRRFDANAQHTLAELARLVEEEFSLNEALAATRTSVNQLLDRDPALPSATHAIAYEKIGRLVDNAGASGRTLGIFYLSLDNLYDMAIAYGPGRIQEMINCWMDDLKRDNEDLSYVARLSERGFVGAFECDGSARTALARCERLRAHAQRETDHEGLRFAFTASAGLCVYPDHGDSGMALIGRAQLAHDNQCWSSETSLFNAGIAKRFRRQATLRSRFEAAVADGAVTFHAQPIFANADRSLAGFELLARWHDPELGDISPAEFVPVIDPEAGPRRALVAHALETACRLVQSWQARAEVVPRVSINLPGAELYQPDLADLVDDTLARYDVEGRHLVFELTERSVIRDFDVTSRALHRLTATGARIAIDDFGSGYSSIAYLTRLPISIVKLDKSVIQRIERHRPARELAQGIVALAHGQQLTIIAEGVETRGQLAQVHAMGCEYTQGFLLGRPQPTDEIDALVARHRTGDTADTERDPASG